MKMLRFTFDFARDHHVEQLGRPLPVLGAQDVVQLARHPDVESPLLTLAVGVERRGEAALDCRQLSEQEVCGLASDPLGPSRGTVDGGEIRVDAQQLRVVVQHLLEVRHPPESVDAVPGEPAGELVVDTASRHGLTRPGRHRERSRVAGARRRMLLYRDVNPIEFDARGGSPGQAARDAILHDVEGVCFLRHSCNLQSKLIPFMISSESVVRIPLKG